MALTLSSVGGRAPFFGRSRELDALSQAIASARDGKGTLIVVGGEAGIGKSRLVNEALATNASLVRVARGNCSESLQAPYLPIHEALGSLRRAGRSNAAADRSIPAEAAMAKKKSSYAEILHGLTTQSKTKPLCLVLEDLQWADIATLEVLEFLAPRLAQTRVCVIATHRSEDVELRSSFGVWFARLIRAGAREVRLDPLTQGEIGALLVATRRGDDPARETLDEICALSEGNPLFAEELLRAALENRHGAIPPTIRAGLLASMSNMGAEGATILTQAAAIGRRFSLGLLERITGASRGNLAEALQRAYAARVIVPESEDAYLFRHALFREVLYQEIVPAARRDLHRRIASEIESLSDDDLRIASLAYHWAEAQDSEKAVAYSVQAAVEAEGLYAYGDAARNYRRALDFPIADDLTRARLTERLATALYAGGDPDEGTRWYEQALAEYERAGDAENTANVLTALARQLWTSGKTLESPALVARATQTLSSAGFGGSPLHLRTLVLSATYWQLLGDLTAAENALEAVGQYPAADDPAFLSRFYDARAMVRSSSWPAEDVIADFRRALALADEIDDVLHKTSVLDNLANFATAVGRMDVVVECRDAALGVAVERGWSWRVAYLALRAAHTSWLLGDLAQTRRQIELSLSTGIEAVRVRALLASIAIPLALATKDQALLRRCSDEKLIEVAFGTGEDELIAMVGAAFFDLYWHRGRTAEALALAQRSARGLRSGSHCWELLDRIARVGDAVATCSARNLLLQEASSPPRIVARAYLSLFDARLAAREGRAHRGIAHASEAARLFESLEWPLRRAAALEIAARDEEASQTYAQVRAIGLIEQPADGSPPLEIAIQTLTVRQREIAGHVSRGKTNREIADLVGISENTVEYHLTAAFAKLGIKTRAQLSAAVARS